MMADPSQLFRQQTELLAALDAPGSVEDIVALAPRVRGCLHELVGSGLDGVAATRLIALYNDRLTVRIIASLARRHRLPPVAWCWLALGSEGRHEQTFVTDQDNGLIFQASSSQEAEALRALFLPFAQEVNQRLADAGFALCSGNIMAGPSGKQEIIDLRQLKDKTKEFILNPMDDENLPEKTEKEIELADGSKWVYPESQGVVSLQTTRDTGYQSYIMVQNELTRAFNEVRDEVAQRKFGAKFSDLPEEQRNVISKAVPLKISEAEPRNIKK